MSIERLFRQHGRPKEDSFAIIGWDVKTDTYWWGGIFSSFEDAKRKADKIASPEVVIDVVDHLGNNQYTTSSTSS